MAGFNACSICAHEIHSRTCPHPWSAPFERWAKEVLRKLKEMVPNQWDPSPPPAAPAA